jgi:hypothetical protein
VLADAYIHELGEDETQVGIQIKTVNPARYGAEDTMLIAG